MTTARPGPLITQEELDTLSASLAVAKAQRRQHVDTATAALYDFRHPARLSPDEIRVLRGRVVSLASVLSRALSLYLGHGVSTWRATSSTSPATWSTTNCPTP